MKQSTIPITVLLVSILITPQAFAVPTQWTSGAGANNHYYEWVANYDISWTNARDGAELLEHSGNTGYLATITSDNENTFIIDTLLQTVTEKMAWIGGEQPGGPEPAGGWTWITGEPWSYTNWSQSPQVEPNDLSPGEDHLMMYLHGDVHGRAGKWNDANSNALDVGGYVVEYLPEPATLGLLLLGGLVLFRRKSK